MDNSVPKPLTLMECILKQWKIFDTYMLKNSHLIDSAHMCWPIHALGPKWNAKGSISYAVLL